jgi:hypothetical protein
MLLAEQVRQHERRDDDTYSGIQIALQLRSQQELRFPGSRRDKILKRIRLHNFIQIEL